MTRGKFAVVFGLAGLLLVGSNGRSLEGVVAAGALLAPTLARRPPRGPDVALLAARLGVQLSREEAGRYMHVDELAGHALTLAKAAATARAAVEAGKDATRPLGEVQRIALEFRARVVRGNDPQGMVLGLRFTSARYTDPDRKNIFFVV